MEIAFYIGTVILVIYYGSKLSSTIERSNQLLEQLIIRNPDEGIADIQSRLIDIGERIREVGALIKEQTSSINHNWEFAEKYKYPEVIEKLNELSSISELIEISRELQHIRDAVDAIAAHPAFSTVVDED